MNPALLETWLSKYEDAPLNLGESGVSAFRVGELLDLTGASGDLLALSLENNDPRGSSRLRDAVVALHDGAIDPRDVLITAGTTEAILIYFHVRRRPGANVVIPSPIFHVLEDVPRTLGFEVRLLPLRPEDNFRMRMDDLVGLVDENTTTVVVNSPHNPTGSLIGESEAEALLELADSYGFDILADEHYRLLPHDILVDRLPSLVGRSSRVVGLGSPGKCLGCIGLRIGWIIIGRAELLRNCLEFKDLTTHTVCSINDRLAAGVLEHREEILGRFRNWVVTNRDLLGALIDRRPDALAWIEPTAGTVAFPRFVAEPAESLERARRLVERTGVLVLPGEAFGLTGYFRINLGVEPGRFAEALHRLEGFLAEDDG